MFTTQHLSHTELCDRLRAYERKYGIQPSSSIAATRMANWAMMTNSWNGREYTIAGSRAFP